MFVFMGLLDLLVSEEQRIKNETAKIEKENRLLEAKVDLKRAKVKREAFRKELETEIS
jgi:hypothetical protein